MSRLCVFMLPLAPDYSGAASALFDLGGIVVMHDASGCTGNFTGYDEPRWMGSRSAVYCSGLRRMDAVLGNDEKFIDATLKAAEESLKQALGSEVRVAYKDGKGKLTVHFYSDEQLKAFANLLGRYEQE